MLTVLRGAGALTLVRDLATARGMANFAEWLCAPSGPTPEEQFELCLGFLLDGIAARVSS